MSSLKLAFALAASLFVASFNAGPARAQEAGHYTAFTLVSRVTDYDAKGNSFPAYTETRYQSASGDWRYVATYPGGRVLETIYRLGDGVYFPDQRGGRLIKVGDDGSGRPEPRGTDPVRPDTKFVGYEMILGVYSDIIRDEDPVYGYMTETYLRGGLGRVPIKRVTTFKNGFRRVEEPVSLTFEEPAASDVRGADYQVIEQVRLSGRNLDKKFVSRPAPSYPPEAKAQGVCGTVTLQITVDEAGNVISARAVSIPLPLLDEAALDAVHKARFSPAVVQGTPVKTAGVVTYEFTLPAAVHD